MKAEIKNRPSFANIHIQLEAGDRVTAEASAMASMSGSVALSTRTNGGFFTAFLRRFFGGESFFINEYTTESSGSLVLTQAWPGDIESIELNGTSLFIQPGAYIASSPGIRLGLGWAGLASWIGGEGLFRLKVSGTGTIWFGSYGGIITKDVSDTYVVDTSHLIAYEPTIQMKVGLAGGLFSSFFSKEGLVSKIKGPGRIYMQSRSTEMFSAWINRQLW
jgi:uncharacterized protein (TIGR00266 family)